MSTRVSGTNSTSNNSNNSSTKSLEHVYYAKLINFDRQKQKERIEMMEQQRQDEFRRFGNVINSNFKNRINNYVYGNYNDDDANDEDDDHNGNDDLNMNICHDDVDGHEGVGDDDEDEANCCISYNNDYDDIDLESIVKLGNNVALNNQNHKSPTSYKITDSLPSNQSQQPKLIVSSSSSSCSCSSASASPSVSVSSSIASNYNPSKVNQDVEFIKNQNNEQILYKLLKTTDNESVKQYLLTTTTAKNDNKAIIKPSMSYQSSSSSATLLIKKSPSSAINQNDISTTPTSNMINCLQNSQSTTDGSKYSLITQKVSNNKPVQQKSSKLDAQLLNYFDSTLLTPLTPLSYSQKQKEAAAASAAGTTTNNNIHKTIKASKHNKTAPNSITVESISPPTLISFDYFNKQQQLQDLSKRTNSSSNNNNNNINNNCSTSYSCNSNVKSASTSYLLSKISSIAQLTMPKNRTNNQNPAITQSISTLSTCSSTSSASSSSSISAASPPIPQSNNNNNNNRLINNLTSKTTKFFNRKSTSSTNSASNASESQLTMSTSMSNSISDSPITNTQIISASKPASPAGNLDLSDQNLQKNLKNVLKSLASTSSTSTTSTTSSTSCTSGQNHVVTSSRRPFKKRSQSIQQTNLNKPLWFFNQVDNYWYTTANNSNQIAESPIFITKIRLNSICIKHLTLIELKYLKQICYNKLQKKFQQLYSISSGAENMTSKPSSALLKKNSSIFVSSSSITNVNNTTVLNTNHHNTASGNGSTGSSNFVRISIPKDESMKTIKTKNISLRSKSVDFKFFEEIKENYFSKNKQKDSSDHVFGQSLYKCILNDLQHSSRSKLLSKNSNSNQSSSNLKQSNSILNPSNHKWKPSNKNNLLIASKFDMNILNGMDLTNNKQLLADLTNQNTMTQPSSSITNSSTSNSDTLLFSKRNSVLFEALDLKNVNVKRKDHHHVTQPAEPNPSTTSFGANLSPESKNHEAISKLLVNNQSLSIRSEGLVPNIVKSCCKYISEHGLDVVGIFRIDSSKKRIKEIKEMFDSGKDVVLNETFNPNDVACILKEYLRSLPEPLLTRDLYNGFLATCKIKDDQARLEAIRHLICLLPVPNRDTLQVLLKLLDKVRSHSEPIYQEDLNQIKEENEDEINCQDEQLYSSIPSPTKQTTKSDNRKIIGGNKMDSFNLAMVFGPNLLKKHKLSSVSTNIKSNDFSDKFNLIDDIDSVISVTKYLIENQDFIFTIEADLHNELIETINNVSNSEINAILTRKIMSSIGIQVLENPIQPNLEPSNLIFDNNNCKFIKTELKSKFVNPRESEASVSTGGSSSASSSSSSSPIYSEQFQFKQKPINYTNADFIDNQINDRIRTSRTKLHKVSTSNLQPINFINSPSHSPTRMQPSNSCAKLIKKNKMINTQSNDAYTNHSDHSGSNKPNQIAASSLLLMVQNNNKPKLSASVSNYHPKPTKSLSSLNILSAGCCDQLTSRRSESHVQPNNQSSNPNQLKINSSTIQICSKFYDNSKYNVIGEQETLV